jgi:hypothetical protein
MCGRYELPNTPKSWAELYELLDIQASDVPDEGKSVVRPTNVAQRGASSASDSS